VTETLLDPQVDVEALARHETAHGVAGRVYGIRVHDCHLRTSLLGQVRDGGTTIDERGVRMVGRWDGFAVLLFAGLTAQLCYLDLTGHLTTRVQRLLEEANRGDWEDWLEIRSLCRITEDTARRRAEQMVTRQWDRIDRAGARLAARKHLAGAEL
jgi:hypothetical protein